MNEMMYHAFKFNSSPKSNCLTKIKCFYPVNTAVEFFFGVNFKNLYNMIESFQTAMQEKKYSTIQ